jgi:hypothetical protein
MSKWEPDLRETRIKRNRRKHKLIGQRAKKKEITLSMKVNESIPVYQKTNVMSFPCES